MCQGGGRPLLDNGDFTSVVGECELYSVQSVETKDGGEEWKRGRAEFLRSAEQVGLNDSEARGR